MYSHDDSFVYSSTLSVENTTHKISSCHIWLGIFFLLVHTHYNFILSSYSALLNYYLSLYAIYINKYFWASSMRQLSSLCVINKGNWFWIKIKFFFYEAVSTTEQQKNEHPVKGCFMYMYIYLCYVHKMRWISFCDVLRNPTRAAPYIVTHRPHAKTYKITFYTEK